MSGRTRVYVEVGGKRAFASAADWPGWCRSGKSEAAALEALASYAPRYAKVARLARVELPKDATNFNVVERLKGNATTDFGAPGIPAKDETKRMTAAETRRMVALLEACWKYLDNVRAKAPFEHVLGAELEYAKRIGLRLKQLDRRALAESFSNPNREEKWPVAYAVRRTAWHALDHAWEMEDRIP
ncbi:MAG: hypothetical protein E6I61_15935 [Chloroflexi bacterium]|nr:MAG: hypothetical protein E6I61_15935 [Chloroflexota bacterium]